MEKQSLLIATQNRGKVVEFGRILAMSGVDIASLSDLGIHVEIEEIGRTFQENASIKASGYARLSRSTTLADDSGLTIDHLDGRPGVRSARYAGEGASDSDRIEKVLTEMKDAANGQRTARFVCALSVSDENGNIIAEVDGVCEGTIAMQPRGTNGFGYDPIFQPDGYEKTFGELDASIKDSISHRARAIAKIIPFLRGFFNI